MNRCRLVVGASLLACLLAGCGAVPMTYAEWKKQQDARTRLELAGRADRSPAQLREEVAEMRRIAQDTVFTPKGK